MLLLHRLTRFFPLFLLALCVELRNIPKICVCPLLALAVLLVTVGGSIAGVAVSLNCLVRAFVPWCLLSGLPLHSRAHSVTNVYILLPVYSIAAFGVRLRAAGK